MHIRIVRGWFARGTGILALALLAACSVGSVVNDGPPGVDRPGDNALTGSLCTTPACSAGPCAAGCAFTAPVAGLDSGMWSMDR